MHTHTFTSDRADIITHMHLSVQPSMCVCVCVCARVDARAAVDPSIAPASPLSSTEKLQQGSEPGRQVNKYTCACMGERCVSSSLWKAGGGCRQDMQA